MDPSNRNRTDRKTCCGTHHLKQVWGIRKQMVRIYFVSSDDEHLILSVRVPLRHRGVRLQVGLAAMYHSEVVDVCGMAQREGWQEYLTLDAAGYLICHLCWGKICTPDHAMSAKHRNKVAWKDSRETAHDTYARMMRPGASAGCQEAAAPPPPPPAGGPPPPAPWQFAAAAQHARVLGPGPAPLRHRGVPPPPAPWQPAAAAAQHAMPEPAPWQPGGPPPPAPWQPAAAAAAAAAQQAMHHAPPPSPCPSGTPFRTASGSIIEGFPGFPIQWGPFKPGATPSVSAPSTTPSAPQAQVPPPQQPQQSTALAQEWALGERYRSLAALGLIAPPPPPVGQPPAQSVVPPPPPTWGHTTTIININFNIGDDDSAPRAIEDEWIWPEL